MITPYLATIAIIASALFLLVIIPLLDGSHRFGKYISLRYTLVVVALTCVLGCILDFSHLQESSRNIVLCGGLALTGLFVVVRSLEKCKLGAKLANNRHIDLFFADYFSPVYYNDKEFSLTVSFQLRLLKKMSCHETFSHHPRIRPGELPAA